MRQLARWAELHVLNGIQEVTCSIPVRSTTLDGSGFRQEFRNRLVTVCSCQAFYLRLLPSISVAPVELGMHPSICGSVLNPYARSAVGPTRPAQSGPSVTAAG